MLLEWKTKRFETLSSLELYELLKLRSEVFVVEQNCVYLDIDGKDEKALHLLGTFEGKIVAYARLFKPNDYFAEASIGRVVTHPDFRDRKIGHILMREAVESIRIHFGESKAVVDDTQHATVLNFCRNWVGSPLRLKMHIDLDCLQKK